MNTDKKLHIRPLQIIEMDGDVHLLRGGVEIKIHGSGERISEIVYEILKIPGLRGGATREEIIDSFAEPERHSVSQLVDHLEQKGILYSGESAWADKEESEEDIFYWNFGSSPQEISGRMNIHQFTIVGVNKISRRLIHALIEADIQGVQVVDDPFLRNLRMFEEDQLSLEHWPDPLPKPVAKEVVTFNPSRCVIATSDFGLTPALSEWNQLCVENGCHFLPVFLANLVGTVGPLVIPGETACFECYCSRENANSEDFVTRRLMDIHAFDRQKDNGFLPSMANIVADSAALWLIRLYAHITQPVVGQVMEYRFLADSMRTRRVLKVPRCRVCNPQQQISPTLLLHRGLSAKNPLSKSAFPSEEESS